MASFIVNYWGIIILVIAALIVAGYYIYSFAKKPSSVQIQKIKEWLLFAVTEAEKEFGSGTGRIKLRFVYDMFLTKFPFLAQVVSFDLFQELTDEVLEQFKELLSINASLQAYIGIAEEDVLPAEAVEEDDI